jgi:hypothetical protein
MRDVFDLTLAFGWGAPSIEDQLKELGIEGVDPKSLEQWQKDADALLRVGVRSLVAESIVNKGLNRLARTIERHLVENKHVAKAT